MDESAVTKTYGEFVRASFKRLRELCAQHCSRELLEPIEYQLSTLERSKGVRPALVLAAHEMHHRRLMDLTDRGAAIAAIHEFTLIIDDILDDGMMRRGKQALRVAYDPVIAGCVAAEFEALASMVFDDDANMRRELRWFKRAVSAAETVQQNERCTTRPFSLERWKWIARGDTGALFDLALSAGGVAARDSDALNAMAYLRHGLDDIDDLFDPDGDQADVRDSVPTLPTCFTEQQTLSGLQRACSPALETLRPFLAGHWAIFPPSTALNPFFDDFAVALHSLRIAAEKVAAPKEVADDVA